MKSCLDITGQKFGRLLAINRSQMKRGASVWKCLCECGNIAEVSISNLRNGHTKSCGCLLKETSYYKGKNRALPQGIAARNSIYNQYRTNANKKHREFNLSMEEFIKLIDGNCFYCGSPPNQIRSATTISTGKYIFNGIDRIDDSKGYTIENCVSCCRDCNVSKGMKTTDEFFDWIVNVYNYNNLNIRTTEII